MFGIDNLKLSLTFSPFLFFLVIILVIGFTIFVYRYTVPNISRLKKVLLVVVRSLTLALLLLAIFEPTLTIIKKNILRPITLFFVDNSRSILVNDGSTNFSNIFENIANDKNNVSAAVILSDGVITDGSNPIYAAEKIGIPVFTVGFGDPTKRKDMAIKNVLYNEFIYAETPTTLTSAIVNEGFANRTIDLSFYEHDLLLHQQNITLSSDGIQTIQLSYTPKTSGEKKLALSLSGIEGEYSKANNRKVFYINVLSNKVKVLLLAGSPSSD